VPNCQLSGALQHAKKCGDGVDSSAILLGEAVVESKGTPREERVDRKRCRLGEGVATESMSAFIGRKESRFLGLLHGCTGNGLLELVSWISSAEKSSMTSAPESPMAIVDRSLACGVEALERGIVTTEAGEESTLILLLLRVGVKAVPPFRSESGFRMDSFMVEYRLPSTCGGGYGRLFAFQDDYSTVE